MKNEMKRTTIITSVVCLIPLVAGIVLYPNLPAQIVTHWDAMGNPNGWSSRFIGAIVLPGIMLLVNILFPFLLKLDPKHSGMSVKIKTLLHWIIPAVDLFASTITLAAGIGADIKVQLYAPLFCGLLFIIVGNFLPKMTQSYTVGIKLPWTLHDEENWDKTHRFAGFVWVICGAGMILCAFFPARMICMCVSLALMVIAPTVYSYLLYRKKNRSQN